MSTTLSVDRSDRLQIPHTPALAPAPRRPEQLGGARAFLRRPLWKRLSLLQLVTAGAATIAPLVIAATIGARLMGLISTEQMLETALAAGEEPGMFTFAAMFLASPVQWLTGRSQVRIRKYLGIVFYILAVSNFAMFAIETGAAAALSAPFLIAGSLAVAVATPLFLTSTRWSQRVMGLRRWKLLHRLTYVVAAALIAHVLAIPEEVGIAEIVIAAGFVLRVPPIRRFVERRRARQTRIG